MKTETTKTYIFNYSEVAKALKIPKDEIITSVWTSIQLEGENLIKVEVQHKQ